MSFQTMLVWFNLVILLYYFNKINLIKKKTIMVVFFGFFIVQSIILFRYEQDTYFLNSEILLIISLLFLLENLKSNKIIILSIIFIISYSNLSFIKLKKNENTTSHCNSLSQNNANEYYSYWTKQIPKNLVLNFCKDRT